MGKDKLKTYWMCIKMGEESFQKKMCVKARSMLSAAKKAWCDCNKHLQEIWILSEDDGQLHRYDTTHFLKVKKEHQLKRRKNKQNE